MTNKKISALTGATTPLAGTELVPVVQSGATTNVTVANLTVGRDVAVKNLGVGGAPDAWYTGWRAVQGRSGSFAVGSNSPGMYVVENAYLNTPAADWIYTDTSPATMVQSYLGVINWHNAPSGTAGNVVSFTKRMSLSLAGDLTVNTGNLVQGTAAKGINFTANTPAAGMTSQLLNWYEEGTWTPNQGGGLTIIGAFSSTGRYTRIGRQVTISGTLAGSTSIAVGANSEMFSNAPVSVLSISLGSAMNTSGSILVNGYLGATNAYCSYAIPATGIIYFQFTCTV